MFDPWKANISEAMDAQQAWIATGIEVGPSDPISQFWAVAHVSARKPICTGEQADGFEVLLCVRICLTHAIAAPDWLVYAFNRRFDAVLNCRAKSWDDPAAFGLPYPKGTHLAALRKARVNAPKVVNAVNAVLDAEPETPIDKSLFQRVGHDLGLGATLTEDLYYSYRMIVPSRKSIRKASRESSTPANSQKIAGLQKRRK